MKLTTPPPGGWPQAVKSVTWTLFFIGVGMGLLIVAVAMAPR
jgi:hypothetical protein